MFGILGIVVLPFLGGFLAIIFGYSAKKKIRHSGGRLVGGGMATAGMVLGFLSFAMFYFLANR